MRTDLVGTRAAQPPLPPVATDAPARAEPPAAFPSWPEIFPPTRTILPLGEDPEFKTASPSMVRGLFVELATVAAALAGRQDPHGPARIHADVLRIAGSVRLSVTSLEIHARRIEVAVGGRLAVFRAKDQPASACELALHAGELVVAGGAPLEIDFLGATELVAPEDVPGHVRLKSTLSGSRDVVEGERGTEIVPGDGLQGVLQLSTAKRLPWLPGRPGVDLVALALEMARWVNRCHAREGGDASLAAESAALIERLRGARRHVRFVPYLRWTEYDELARQTADALVHVEARSQRLFDRSEDRGRRKEAAQDLLKHYANATQLSARLRDQAKEEMDRAGEVARASADKLEKASDDVKAAKAAFDAGVKAKEHEQLVKGILGIIGAVGALALGIVVACTGNPAGAAAAAGAAEAVGAAAQQVSKLKQIIDRIAKAIEAIKKAVDAVSALAKAYAFVSKEVGIYSKCQELKTWGKKDVTEDAPVPADWEAFTVDMGVLLEEPIELEIAGAREYLAALEKLSIRAKDAIDTGFQFARCAQVYQQRLWEMERDRQDVGLVEERLDLVVKQGDPDLVTRMFFERLGDQLKQTLAQAIDKLGDALRYYALTEPSITPDLTLSAAELEAQLATAKGELEAARERFRPPPASFGPIVQTVTAERTLERFRAERKLSCAISLESPGFQGFDRIRIGEIRVWLVGKGLDEQVIKIAIATSGSYLDRLGTGLFEFAAEPLDRRFWYRHARWGKDLDHHGEPVTIEARANDAEQSYFEPTPFTTWEISVPETLNKDLPLERVTEIGLEFWGSYIGSSLLRGALAPSRPPLKITIL